MKVILLDNIRGVGRVGDVKNVADGYARNFLLPRGKARAATDTALKDAALLTQRRDAEDATARSVAAAAAQKLAGTVVRMAGKANAKGKLFAALTPEDVVDALAAQSDIRVPADAVVLAEHLKTVGDHPVALRLADGVEATVTVSISAE